MGKRNLQTRFDYLHGANQAVLTFGDLPLKADRKTPFFINTGNYKRAVSESPLGEFYAQALRATSNDFDALFGPGV